MTVGEADPRCGGCGYSVIGLPTTTCPECGADLDAVGILTGTQQHSRLRLRRLGWWTAIVFVAIPVLFVAGSFVPLPQVTQQQRMIFCQPGLRGGLFQTILASTERRSWGAGYSWPQAPIPLDVVTLSLSGSSTPRPDDLRVDWHTKAYHYTVGGRTVSHSSGFDSVTLLTWMSDCGCQPTVRNGGPTAAAQMAQSQAAGVLAAVDQMPVSGGRFSYLNASRAGGVAHSTFIYTVKTRVPPSLPGLGLLIVWAGGAIYLFWRR